MLGSLQGKVTHPNPKVVKTLCHADFHILKQYFPKIKIPVSIDRVKTTKIIYIYFDYDIYSIYEYLQGKVT